MNCRSAPTALRSRSGRHRGAMATVHGNRVTSRRHPHAIWESDGGLVLRKKHRPAIVRRTKGGQGKMESTYDLTPEVTAGAMPSTHTPHRTSRPPSVAVARVVVTAITGLFLYIGVRVGQAGSTTEIIVLLALLCAAAACTVVAWWQATMGGLALGLVGGALGGFFLVFFRDH